MYSIFSMYWHLAGTFVSKIVTANVVVVVVVAKKMHFIEKLSLTFNYIVIARDLLTENKFS